MKIRLIIKVSLGVALLAFAGFELGIIQRVFDSRSIVEDGVLGADYWIIKVDGEPTSRVQHGVLITKVPLALIEPGERIFQLSEDDYSSSANEIIEFRVTIRKGENYRIAADAEGNPKLIVKR